MSQPERLATAEWANPDEVAAEHPFQPGAFWLGRSPVEPRVPLGFVDDRHVCLVSGSRGGKGTSAIINNLCLWPGSLVVIDPKGENATVTAARRGPGSEFCEGMGQAVHVLDPFGAATVDEKLRSRFNPLDAIDPKSELAPDEVGRLAEALVVRGNSNDPYWDDTGRQILKTIILHVLSSAAFEGRRTLTTVRRLITHGDERFYEDMLNDPVLEEEDRRPPSPRELLWVGISRNNHYDGKIAGPGMQFHELYKNPKSNFESLLQVVSRNTEFLDSAPMQRCLAASDFKLSDLKTRPEGMSLYLSLPQRYMADHFRWLRMMVTLVTNEMEATPGRPARGHPVLICLDEFAGLKRLEAVENAVAQIAGFGVKLFFCLQSLEQLKGTYPDKWETFLSNCGLKLFFNLEDHFSREYVSKFIGETEIIRTTQSVGENFTTTRSTTTNTGESTADTVGDSFTKSTNSGTTHGTSRGKSRNWGGSLSTGTSEGATVSHNWGLNPILFRTTSKFLSLVRQDETTNRGTNRGTNRNESESWGGGDSFSENTGTSYGTSEAVARNTSQTVTKTTGTATTKGDSRGTTEGWSEAVHKRPLITTDELGIYFSAVRDRKSKAYPGLALVLASGQRPLAVHRANYFDDDEFIGCYDAHPNHLDFKPKPLWVECPVEVPPEGDLAVLWETCPAGTPLLLDAWQVVPGNPVARGQPLARLKFGCRETAVDPLKWLTTELPVPFSGTLTRLASGVSELEPDRAIAWIKVNRRRAQLESLAPIPDCIEELVSLLLAETAQIERAEQARRAEQAKREQASLAAKAAVERAIHDCEARHQVFLARAEAHDKFHGARRRGWCKWWKHIGMELAESLLTLGVLAVLVLSWIAAYKSYGFRPRVVAFSMTFLKGWLSVIIFGLPFAALDWFLKVPRNPPDSEDADVRVEASGFIRVIPVAPDGYLSPAESVAFIRTAFQDPRIVQNGINLQIPASQASSEVETTNLALLYHAAKVNLLKVSNQAQVESFLANSGALKKQVAAKWRAALP